jgi:recombination protein RecT
MRFNWSGKTSDRKLLDMLITSELINGYKSTFYMKADQIEQHAKKYSETYKKGFGKWVDDFDLKWHARKLSASCI